MVRSVVIALMLVTVATAADARSQTVRSHVDGFPMAPSARDVLRAKHNAPPFGASRMVASFYDCHKPGECSAHKITASGERFNERAMTAAHKKLPFGTRLRVCYHLCVVVRINDRGPFVAGRQLDLSAGAARAIGMTGVAAVQVGRSS